MEGAGPDMSLRQLAIAAAEEEEDMIVVGEVVEDGGNVASREEVESEHKEGMGRTAGEAHQDCGTEGESVVAGRSWCCRDSHRDCISAAQDPEDRADCGCDWGGCGCGCGCGFDYMVSSCPYLAACLALPADDGRSSCRRGRLRMRLSQLGRVWGAGRRKDVDVECVFFGDQGHSEIRGKQLYAICG